MVSPRRVTFQRAGNPRRFQGRISASFWLQRLLTLGTSCSFSNFPTRALLTPNLNCRHFCLGAFALGFHIPCDSGDRAGLDAAGAVDGRHLNGALGSMCFEWLYQIFVFPPLGVLCLKDNTKLSEDIVSVRRFDMAYVCAQARKLPVLHGVGRCAESALAKFRDLRIAGPLAQETKMCVCVCVCFGPTWWLSFGFPLKTTKKGVTSEKGCTHIQVYDAVVLVCRLLLTNEAEVSGAMSFERLTC